MAFRKETSSVYDENNDRLSRRQLLARLGLDERADTENGATQSARQARDVLISILHQLNGELTTAQQRRLLDEKAEVVARWFYRDANGNRAAFRQLIRLQAEFYGSSMAEGSTTTHHTPPPHNKHTKR